MFAMRRSGSYAARSAEYQPVARPEGLQPGHYKARHLGGWMPVLVAIENSTDDDGIEADRPRLVLYFGDERHERPAAEQWQHKIWPISEDEWRRLKTAHENIQLAPWFNLNSAGSLF